MEPGAVDRHHMRVDLDHGRRHTQRLVREARDRARAQAQLQRAAFAHRVGGQPQQAGQHALHVVELHHLRLADAHRALHPDRTQVQETHAVGFADRGFRKLFGHARS
jgi:hypothetical protein